MNETHCIATLLTCATLASVGCTGCQESSPPVRQLPAIRVSAEPEWDARGTAESGLRGKPSEVAIHLDISYPMAGFLDPASDGSELSALHVTAQNLSQHMKRIYGGTDVPVHWYGVGREVRKLDPSPPIHRDLFNGRSTRLDLSINKILADLRSGYSDAAAIVTDLMATGQVTGPLDMVPQLREWLQTDEVRSGEFHVGLFGVKAHYWGVFQSKQCPPGPRLGCWYNERVKKFERLASVEFFPIYTLVLGRGSEQVTSIMESLQRGIDEMNQSLEVQWELLTSNSRGFETALSCEAGIRGDGNERGRQYALVVNQNGECSCQRNGTVTLYCAFDGDDDSFLPTEGRASWTVTSGDAPAEAEVRVDRSGALEVDVDCSAIRNTRADVKLALDITGRATRRTKDWSDWSTEVAALGKTLNLEGFVQAVRLEPDRYRVEFPAILHFP